LIVRLGGAAVVLCLLWGVLAGGSVTAGAQEPKPDPKAQALVDQMVTAYRDLPALHEKVTLTWTALPGAPAEGGTPKSLELRWQKPNRFALSYEEEKAGKPVRHQAVSNGVTLWQWRSDTNVAAKDKAPAKPVASPVPGAGLPEIGILFAGKNPFVELPLGATFAVGKPEKLGELDLDVLEARIAEKDVPFSGILRVKLGQKDHLIRSMLFEGGGKDPDSNKDQSFKIEAVYEVNAAPTFTPADFAFTPPPGAKVKTPAAAPPPTRKPAQAGKPAKGKR
jgi:outer membrane lipoprotein-sorting protein